MRDALGIDVYAIDETVCRWLHIHFVRPPIELVIRPASTPTATPPSGQFQLYLNDSAFLQRWVPTQKPFPSREASGSTNT